MDDDGALSAGLPKPYVELVVSLHGLHWWRAEPHGVEHRFEHSWVTPLQSAPRYARSDGARRLIGARLEPWLATALFGPLPPGDGRPPIRLTELIGQDAGALRESLLSATDEESAFEILGIWLEMQIRSRATAISFCLDALSERTARRRYARDVGVSPKRWQLLHRLDRLLRDPDSIASTKSLAHLAMAHGFADQSHMSRELLRMTGATASQLRRRNHHGPPHLIRQE